MQTRTLSIPQNFPKNTFTVLLILTILGVIIYGIITFWVASKILEEVIDDDVVWEEIKDLEIPEHLEAKMISEIEGLQAKPRTRNPCNQYILIAGQSGQYFCNHRGLTFLNQGEIWKIGKTCLDEDARYSGGLPDPRLLLEIQFTGTELQCLIIEKVRLYSYFFHPENAPRKPPLHLPPGNKIYR